MGLLEVVDEFLVLVSIVDGEFEFSFFGPEDDRLPFHAADHVEGSLGLAAQSYLQEVFLDAFLDGFAQLGGDFEVTIRRTETFNALVRAFVIIVSNPKPDALAHRLDYAWGGAENHLRVGGSANELDNTAQREVLIAQWKAIESIAPGMTEAVLKAVTSTVSPGGVIGAIKAIVPQSPTLELKGNLFESLLPGLK